MKLRYDGVEFDFLHDVYELGRSCLRIDPICAIFMRTLTEKFRWNVSNALSPPMEDTSFGLLQVVLDDAGQRNGLPRKIPITIPPSAIHETLAIIKACLPVRRPLQSPPSLLLCLADLKGRSGGHTDVCDPKVLIRWEATFSALCEAEVVSSFVSAEEHCW
jgi:hypothetical protein